MPSFEYLSRGFRVFIPTTFGLLAAGCSADVARFDFPGLTGFADSQTNSIPIPPATVHSPGPRAGLIGDQGGEPLPPPTAEYGAPPRDVRVAELPPASGAPVQGQAYGRDYDRGYQDRSYQDRGSQDRGSQGYQDRGPQSPGYETTLVRSYDAAPRSRIPVAPRAEQLAYDKQAGEQVEVKPGDTLYGLSRRHNVSVPALTEANDIKGHSLKPGQRLTIPSSDGARRHTSAKLEAAPPSVEPAAQATPATRDTTTADAAGTYTMKPGDSLYAIARKHNVKYAELQHQNGISDVRKVRPGTVLKIPGAGGSSAPASPPEQASPAPPPSNSQPSAATSHSDAGAASNPAESPKVLNASPLPSVPQSTAVNEPVTAPPAAPAEPEKRVAAVDPQTSTPVMASERTPQDKSSVRLRWPVQGKIISQFGPRADGTHNDGVNFSVPLGTEVHAAEDGEVIYVGDELKAYGKLVLVRHDNGWVTAYAHNDELAVKRGDKVKRGQIVAKAGKTGPVDQPQVHFELRQDSKAVDPTSYMERL